ncbi:hypothetical protein ASZ90_017930 [hydrocarbon metagenome]|uniref:Uncharacterized protein n=1 Tax=hydrocarbon metagenome TaxID=938273 RepID=A0A0W8E885_9ZZZZ
MIIHDLARDGVRAGVVGSTESEIKNYIKTNESIVTLDKDNDIKVYPDEDGIDRVVGGQLKVTIDYNMNIITPIISSLIEDDEGQKNKWVRAKYVMRIEQLP